MPANKATNDKVFHGLGPPWATLGQEATRKAKNSLRGIVGHYSRGMPTNKVRVKGYCSIELKREVVELARKKERSESWIVIQAIKRYLEQEKRKQANHNNL